MSNRKIEYITNYSTNFKVELKSIVVDVAHDLDFDIYKYFGIELPQSLIAEWDSDAPIPFHCEVEAIIYSGERPITAPITLTSDQYSILYPNLPNISILHNISREQHTFTWNYSLEMPIFYSELPVDSVLVLSFYARLFQVPPKLIGKTSVRLFTQRTRRFRNGPFTLGFDDAPTTKLQKHIRRLDTYKIKSYEFVDDQLRTVSESLHPNDAYAYFLALLNPEIPPKLSDYSQFVKIILPSPCSVPSTIIKHQDLILQSINTCNPVQSFFSALTHIQGLSRTPLKDSNTTEDLNKIKAMAPLADLPAYHKNFIFNHYLLCLNDQELLPALFRSVNWNEEDEAREISKRLKDKDPIDLEFALEFFTSRYNFKPVREYAVRCIQAVSGNDILLYIPQLLQALKADYTDGLGDILLGHAIDDKYFATHLFWACQIEKNTDSHIGHLLNQLLEQLPKNIREEINLQEILINRIHSLLKASRESEKHEKIDKPAQIRERTIQLLKENEEHSKLVHFPPTMLPLDPTLTVVGIDPNDVRVFQSKLCPSMLTFELENGEKYRVLFKIGDDMQQDQLIIQLFEVMDQIFRKASLQLYITAYKTLAFTKDFGCCQFIENSKAIRDINKNNLHILDFLQEDNGPLEEKIDIFTASLAAYCVMTYVLKIGDRHDNNILVCRDGRLLHIDYGFILGDVAKPFSPPIKISNEMIQTIGKDGLQKICGWAGPAFNSLRKRARLILEMLELMFTAPLECFNQNPMRRLQQVENSLLLNCSELEAINSLQATFEDALNSFAQVIWDKVHVIALSANAPSAEK